VICHVVFYRMKPGTTEADERRLIEMARQTLPRVRGVRNLRAGKCLAGSEKGYSVALVMDFEDAAALEAYRVDAGHQKFVNEIAGPLVQEIWRFDFEG
jgi:hypothetical protein